MRVRTSLPLNSIKMDRWPICPATLSLVKFLEAGNKVPPIHVQPDGLGTFLILDGRHRVTACKLLGRTKIEVRYGIKEEVEPASCSPSQTGWGSTQGENQG